MGWGRTARDEARGRHEHATGEEFSSSLELVEESTSSTLSAGHDATTSRKNMRSSKSESSPASMGVVARAGRPQRARRGAPPVARARFFQPPGDPYC